MGQLRNADHNVTINEVTVSHRALKNSPHDALTWDIQGIRGVVIDGQNWFTNDSTVVRSVNVTFDGVSFECDAGMLDVLSDPAVRKELVEKSLAAQREREALEASLHEWRKDEKQSTAVKAAWQCRRCKGWVATDPEVAQEDAPLPQGGCLGREATPEEKKQQDAKAAIQELGRRLMALHERARVLLQNGAPADDVVAAFLGLSGVDEALKFTEADTEAQ
jgi:hypothetical protein